MTDELTLRRAHPDDADRLHELNEVALRGVDAFAEEATNGDLDDVRSVYLDAGGEFLVGQLDGEVVAMGALKPVGEAEKPWAADRILAPDDGPAAEITRMRIDPGHQRKGYGTRILEELETCAREREFDVLVLDTTARQAGARHLYESFGYERVEAFEWREYEVLLYRKDLG